MVQPQHLHIVPFIIIILITVILLLLLLLLLLLVLLLLFEMLFLFSVNPILSFCSFESKKSVVVDVVIAAKHL